MLGWLITLPGNNPWSLHQIHFISSHRRNIPHQDINHGRRTEGMFLPHQLYKYATGEKNKHFPVMICGARLMFAIRQNYSKMDDREKSFVSSLLAGPVICVFDNSMRMEQNEIHRVESKGIETKRHSHILLILIPFAFRSLHFHYTWNCVTTRYDTIRYDTTQ